MHDLSATILDLPRRKNPLLVALQNLAQLLNLLEHLVPLLLDDLRLRLGCTLRLGFLELGVQLAEVAL